VELGIRLLPPGFNRTGLPDEVMTQVARGSYMVNGAADGCSCHTTDAGYMAGGREFPLSFTDPQGFNSVVAWNLTPDPETGMTLTQEQFIEALRTGKDFHNSTPTAPQRFMIMPWPRYRFLSRDDLIAIYTFLRHVPPVRHETRRTLQAPATFTPLPPPTLEDSAAFNGPDNANRGLHIPQVFSSGDAAVNFYATFSATVARLAPEQQAKVGRGSYVLNTLGGCNDCHTDGNGDGRADNGRLPGTFDVGTAGYLAGGVDIGTRLGKGPIRSRNLTPDPDTGFKLSEEQFISVLRFGADFSRPTALLRVDPHFPAGFRLTLDDLQAIYAYLHAIPPVVNAVPLVP
jgi:mono/diheme cytochrome c family protein